jgi:signal transduction histidine kinase
MASQHIPNPLAELLAEEAMVAGSPVLGRRSLARAFAGFAAAAASLEHSYSELQSEVERLRRELEGRNHDLAQSLEENRAMRQHLDRVVQGLPCGVLVVDAESRISLCNPEASRLLSAVTGIPPENVQQATPAVTRWIGEVLADRAEREYRCPRNPLSEDRCEEDEGGGHPAEGMQQKADWIAARPSALVAGLSSMIILRDITSAKQLEEQREHMHCRHALAEMSGLLAHEIRNPLASLELFAGLLAGARLDAEPHKWVEHMQAGLRLLGATVNNVLHFHSQQPLSLAPTDLGNLLDWLKEFLCPLAQQAQVHLDLRHQLDGVEVAADRHRLEQVVLNLALNAFRFMPGGGTLKIAGRVHGTGRRKTAQLELCDTGCGITAGNLQRIFAAGFTTRAGSPGLGLAVCRTIMQQHGGEITVSSRPGQGSRFALNFPLPSLATSREVASRGPITGALQAPIAWHAAEAGS